jgi:hypothetical protein
MNVRMNFLILAIVLLTVLPLCVYGQMKNMDNKDEIYEKTINQIISCCNSKSRLANSEHDKIRMTGELALRKAEFCVIYKRLLIEEMIQMDLPPKVYKINYFINSKFYETERNSLSTGR